MRVTKDLTKLYYSIGEISEMFDVSPSLLRYWETEFKNLKPQKNRKGDRKFTTKDIHEIEKIYTLVKERGFTLLGAQKELKGNKSYKIQAEVIKKLERNLKANFENYQEFKASVYDQDGYSTILEIMNWLVLPEKMELTFIPREEYEDDYFLNYHKQFQTD